MYGFVVFTLFAVSVSLLALFGSRFGIYTEMLEFTRIAIWPAVVMSALLFFRKTLTYLIFSLEEINVFGAKSRLKSVREVIDDKAKEIIEREKKELLSKRKIEELESNLKKLKERTKNKDRIAEIANDLINENTELWEILHRKEQEIEETRGEGRDELIDLESRVKSLEAELGEVKKIKTWQKKFLL